VQSRCLQFVHVVLIALVNASSESVKHVSGLDERHASNFLKTQPNVSVF
jgi:hypothetical protein